MHACMQLLFIQVMWCMNVKKIKETSRKNIVYEIVGGI